MENYGGVEDWNRRRNVWSSFWRINWRTCFRNWYMISYIFVFIDKASS